MKKTLLRRLVLTLIPVLWGAYMKRRRERAGRPA